MHAISWLAVCVAAASGCATFDGTVKGWTTARVVAAEPLAVRLVVRPPRVIRVTDLSAADAQRLSQSLQRATVGYARRSQGFASCGKPASLDHRCQRVELLTRVEVTAYRAPHSGLVYLAALPFALMGGLQAASYLVTGKLAGHVQWTLRDARGRTLARHRARFDQDPGVAEALAIEPELARFLRRAVAALRPMALARPATVGRPVVAGARGRPIAAVFPIEDATKLLPDSAREHLADWVAARLTETASYRVVSMHGVRRRVEARARRRRVSRADQRCTTRVCQIEIGQALAAAKTVVVRLTRGQGRCVATVVVYDLITETTDRAGSAPFAPCTMDRALAGLRQAVAGLGAKEEREHARTR